MDVEQLDKACREYPVVQELMKDNLHLSVSALAREIRDKVILLDGNHTRAQAKLVDELKELEARTKQAVAGLHNRIKKLENASGMGIFTETLEKIVERIEMLEAAEAERATAMEQAAKQSADTTP